MQVSLIGVANIDAIWPFLREGFHRSVMKTGGDLDTGELWVQCRSGAAFLIVATETLVAQGGEDIGDDPARIIRGASIWKPQTWQSGRKLRCLALYGHEMTGWIQDMKAMAERLAKDNGATALVSEGRMGWQKVFPNAKVLRSLYEEEIR